MSTKATQYYVECSLTEIKKSRKIKKTLDK